MTDHYEYGKNPEQVEEVLGKKDEEMRERVQENAERLNYPSLPEYHFSKRSYGVEE